MSWHLATAFTTGWIIAGSSRVAIAANRIFVSTRVGICEHGSAG